MKRCMNASLLYAILAMVGGVFYREFTKFNGLPPERPSESCIRTTSCWAWSSSSCFCCWKRAFPSWKPKRSACWTAYQVGLNLTAVMFVVRGVPQVLGTELSAGMNAAISGIAGIGHILLGISMVMLLLQVRKSVAEK